MVGLDCAVPHISVWSLFSLCVRGFSLRVSVSSAIMQVKDHYLHPGASHKRDC